MKILRVKYLYVLTMILIVSCVVVNAYQLFNPQNLSLLYRILNIATSIITFLYLLTIIKRKRILLKKINDQIHKVFSKN